MSIIGSNILAGASGQGGGYTIENSLRFRSSASAYLNRTFGSGGDLKTYTISFWIKRGKLGAQQFAFTGFNGSISGNIQFTSSDTLTFNVDGGVNYQLITTQVFRDPSAWYHVVCVADTTQATPSNRLKIYVNGVQVISFGTATYPTLNYDTKFFGAYSHWIGASQIPSLYTDGYLAEFNAINGQALDPSDFGEYNEDTGVWQPVAYAGTYGTNGFYLPFSDATNTTTLVADASGNGNDWTPNNISLTSGATYDSMTDTPTIYADGGNYAVLNPIDRSGNAFAPTTSNANLSAAPSGNPTHIWSTITLPVGSTEGWYWEGVCTTMDTSRTYVGIIDPTTTSGAPGASYAFVDKAILSRNGGYYNTANGTGGTPVATFTAYAVNDVVMIAYKNGKIWFGKNGTWMNSGDPATDTNAVDSAVSTARAWRPYFGYNSSWTANFGQRPFAYTPPTGFLPLHTGNLPDSTIVDGSEYFNTVLYEGNNGASLEVTGAGFQPDLIWIKNRSTANNHNLVDAVRGVNLTLFSNTTDDEDTSTERVTSIDSDGFTVGTNNGVNAADSYVSWLWKANGAGVSNTDGSITSTVSANPTAGFSVVTYTGTGANATVGHGLGVAPKFIIIKGRNTPYNWAAWHGSFTGLQRIFPNTTGAVASSASYWNSAIPTSTTFSLGSEATANDNNGTFVAYCFAEVPGYSSFGSYTGNGSADGTFVFLGFKPKFILFKSTSARNWVIRDTSRNTYNAVTNDLYPDSASAEYAPGDAIDFLSNGFKLRATGATFNGSGEIYIYAAFAENPFKNSLAR